MSRKGFSLTEMVFVLAIVSALLLACSMPVSRMTARHHLDRAIWEMHSKLNEARITALWEGVPTRIRFDAEAYFLEAYSENSKKWMIRERIAPAGVAIESNNNPVFNPSGAVSGLASILISNLRGSFKITIAITGRIKIVRIS
jgi:prepilin-type N-terminal cleavage/methylation domain-containing protein